MSSHSHAAHHRGPHYHPTSQCRIEDDMLVVSPPSRQVMRVPLAGITGMAFRVGTAAQHDWHDYVIVRAPGQLVHLTSMQADPSGIRESRAAYRKLVRKLIRRTAELQPNVQLYEGNFPLPAATTNVLLFVLAALALGLGVCVVGQLNAVSIACVALSVVLVVFGVSIKPGVPPPSLDPVSDLDRMIPPRDAA